MKFLKILAVILAVIAAIVFIATRFISVNVPLKVISHDYKGDLPLETLKLPEGFGVHIYATGVTNARSMCFGSSDATLFVGTRSEGNVYALRDTNQDYIADEQYFLLKKGNMPNGVAFKDGDLYIAEVNRILRFKDIESKLENPGEPEVVYDQYPSESHHGWKYIAFGPDGKLYIPVGAPCNMCESEEIYASMTRLDISTNQREIVQHGIRNSVGFDWDPKTNDLWFTDNGRDMLGDEIPNCELNHATKDNMHFGYPYCHQGDLLDPEYGKGKNCKDFTSPAEKLGPHTAPLGLEFYTGDQFPIDYKNGMFIARHGSWNRKEKIGYDVYNVLTDSTGRIRKSDIFISGWLSDDKKDVWGRPVDIKTCSDGSILISDDFADAIYRVYYNGPEEKI